MGEKGRVSLLAQKAGNAPSPSRKANGIVVPVLLSPFVSKSMWSTVLSGQRARIDFRARLGLKAWPGSS